MPQLQQEFPCDLFLEQEELQDSLSRRVFMRSTKMPRASQQQVTGSHLPKCSKRMRPHFILAI